MTHHQQAGREKREPVRIGDKFVDTGGHTWEVIGRGFAGRLSLFDKKRSRFMDMYQRNMSEWKRAAIAEPSLGRRTLSEAQT